MSARYAAEIASDFSAMEREARQCCPKAWELSTSLDALGKSLSLDDPALRYVERLQLHTLRAIDERRDVSVETWRYVRMAIASIKGLEG